MTLSPKLSTEQLLRIEALKIAQGDFNACVPEPDWVTARADAYLAFLKDKNTLPAFPLTSQSRRKK